MLVGKDTWDKSIENTVRDCADKCNAEGNTFLACNGSAIGSVHGTNGKGSGSRCGEDKFLLEDVELAERHCEEATVKGRAEAESEQSTKIFFWRAAQQT